MKLLADIAPPLGLISVVVLFVVLVVIPPLGYVIRGWSFFIEVPDSILRVTQVALNGLLFAFIFDYLGALAMAKERKGDTP